ncbi:hypothetical protein [Oenococcus oeni]
MQAFNTAGWQITNADARYTDPEYGSGD